MSPRDRKCGVGRSRSVSIQTLEVFEVFAQEPETRVFIWSLFYWTEIREKLDGCQWTNVNVALSFEGMLMKRVEEDG